MDEIISKLAVIQIIEKMRARIGHNLERAVGRAMIEILDEVGEDVEKLPSAQPTFDARDTQYNLPIGTDCISREQAIDAVKRLSLGETDATRLAMRIEDYLERLPSAQPKHGKWIEDKGQQTLMKNFIERGEVWRVCSVCGAGHMIGHRYAIDKAYHDRHHNFCPNCGAKMEVTE